MLQRLLATADWWRASLARWFVSWNKRFGDLVDLFKLRGDVEFRLIHASGPQKGQVAQVIRPGRNIVTGWLSGGGAAPTSGRDLMRRRLVHHSFAGSLSADANATVQYIQLGSGTTAEATTDTALVTPIVASLKAISSVEFDATNPYVTFIVEYTEAEVNQTISEASLLSGRATKDFLARKTFGAFTKTSDYILQVRWQIRI